MNNQIALRIVACFCMLACAAVSSAMATTVPYYSQSFEVGALGPEWQASGSSLTATSLHMLRDVPASGATFLYNPSVPPQPVRLQLQNLPPHDSINLGFLLAIIRSWDGLGGSPGPDVFNVTVDGVSIFSEMFGVTSGTTTYLPANNQLIANTEGKLYDMALEPRFQNIPHSSATLTVQWFASGPGWQGGNDEAWGIDNVQVFVNSAPPVITSILPTQGVVGDTVAIQGIFSPAATSVSFSGTSAVSVTSSPSRVTCIVPLGATTGPVTVTNAFGSTSSAQVFTVHRVPSIATVSPLAAKPGDVLTLTGANFDAVERVVLGGQDVAGFGAISPTVMYVTVGLSNPSGPITLIPTYGPNVVGPNITVVPLDPHPHFNAIYDVPRDQGGAVFLTWQPSDYERFSVLGITGYRVWRRAIPPIAAKASLVEVSAGNSHDVNEGKGVWWANAATGAQEYWEPLATLPAARMPGYAYAASTTEDSLPGQVTYTAFMVQALTNDSFSFFLSEVDSAYSVDNLAPPVPAAFAVRYGANRNVLHWLPSRAPDVREYRLYRGLTQVFEPSPANLVIATSDTGYVDTPGLYFYKLRAVDVHGNASRTVMVSADRPVATLAALVSAEAQGGRIRVAWYSGGDPNLQATLYRRTQSMDWRVIGSLIAGPGGMLRYDDEDVVAGTLYGYRLGIVDGDAEVFVGEAWVSAEGPQVPNMSYVVHPNPSHGAKLTAEFSLATASPARVDVMDIGGRRVLTRAPGMMGAGHHKVDLLQGAALAPGVYMVRLTAGPSTKTLRVVVVP